MILYLEVFFLISILSFFGNKKNYILRLLALFLILFVGLRYEVGGDWSTYLENYKNFNYSLASFFQLSIRESGWLIATYISKIFSSGEIWPLNLICATIFFIGLLQFALSCKNSTFVFVLAFPILICLVAMGYTRQSAAMGFELLGISRLNRNKFPWLLFFIAGLFHNTFFLVAAYLYIFKTRKIETFIYLALILIGVICILNLFIPLVEFYSNTINEYIFTNAYIAEGAVYRGLFCLTGSVAYLYLMRKNNNWQIGDLIYQNMAFGAIVLFLLILIVPLTAFDRLLIYFSPIYLYTFSNIDFVHEYSSVNYNNVFQIIVIILFGIFTAIWFQFGVNATYWIPYNNYLSL